MITCLITGCALVHRELSVWGDLHATADAFIFNANLFYGKRAENDAVDNVEGEARWRTAIVADGIKTVTYCGQQSFFERRGVIVFSKVDGVLNGAAHDYLGRKY